MTNRYSLAERVKRAKRRWVIEALMEASGNQCVAAALLGVHRNTISRLLTDLNLYPALGAIVVQRQRSGLLSREGQGEKIAAEEDLLRKRLRILARTGRWLSAEVAGAYVEEDSPSFERPLEAHPVFARVGHPGVEAVRA